MIVVCPNCSKRYMLDDNLVPKEGRQVRCITCHQVWRQAQTASSAIDHFSVKEINSPLDVRLSSEKKSGWVRGLLSLAILISLLSAVTFGRDYVVKFWPQTDRFYALFGLPISPQGTGLTIANATSLLHHNGTNEMIQVAGDITNTSDRVRLIPLLKIKFIGESSQVLDSWEHCLSEHSLLPGEQIRFETEPRPKIEGIHHVSVEF